MNAHQYMWFIMALGILAIVISISCLVWKHFKKDDPEEIEEVECKYHMRPT
jgi:hypothetical protein